MELWMPWVAHSQQGLIRCDVALQMAPPPCLQAFHLQGPRLYLPDPGPVHLGHCQQGALAHPAQVGGGWHCRGVQSLLAGKWLFKRRRCCVQIAPKCDPTPQTGSRSHPEVLGPGFLPLGDHCDLRDGEDRTQDVGACGDQACRGWSLPEAGSCGDAVWRTADIDMSFEAQGLSEHLSLRWKPTLRLPSPSWASLLAWFSLEFESLELRLLS